MNRPEVSLEARDQTFEGGPSGDVFVRVAGYVLRKPVQTRMPSTERGQNEATRNGRSWDRAEGESEDCGGVREVPEVRTSQTRHFTMIFGVVFQKSDNPSNKTLVRCV